MKQICTKNKIIEKAVIDEMENGQKMVKIFDPLVGKNAYVTRNWIQTRVADVYIIPISDISWLEELGHKFELFDEDGSSIVFA